MHRMKSGISIRVGGGPALGERVAPQTLGNGGSEKAVVLHCLVSKSKETEEDKRGKDSRPPSELVCG